MRIALSRFLILSVVVAVAALSTIAVAQNGDPSATPADSSAAATTGGSFAGTFFISRVTHANGEQTIDFVGSILVWSLLALSMVNVGLIGYLAIVNQRKHIVPTNVVTQMKQLLATGNYRQAVEMARKDPSFFCHVLHAGLAEAGHGFAAIVRSLEQAADVAIAKRMRPIEVLYMFGQVSPMMGLLGTVYGIIFAFRVFVAMGGRASPALLAGGIGTALVATFWGLVVAIPALGAYSFLRNKVDQLTTEAIASAEELLAPFRPKAGTTTKPIASSKPAPQSSSPTP